MQSRSLSSLTTTGTNEHMNILMVLTSHDEMGDTRKKIGF